MVRLTEEMVIARTRISDLTAVKKLNCWGTDLTDVSIVRDLKKVEVLSFSVNNIDTLADFQYCFNLKDLFVRRNNITDLNEVCYLQNLTNLRNLWLGENPCSNQEGYRLAVLRALPDLEKLDDKPVTTEEIQNALAKGRILVHPLEMDASPSRSDTPSPEQFQQQQQQQQQQQGYAVRGGSHHASEDHQETDRRNANWNSSPTFQPNYQQNNQYGYELLQNGETRSKTDDRVEAHLIQTQSSSILDNLTPVISATTTNTLGIFKEYDDQVPSGESERTRRRRRHSSSNGEDTTEDYRQHQQQQQQQHHYPSYSDNASVSGEHEAGTQRSNLGQIESTTPTVSPRASYPPLDYDERHQSSGIAYDDKRHFETSEGPPDLPKRTSASAGYRHTPVDRDEALRDREMSASAGPGWSRHSEKEKCRYHYHRRPVTRNSNILSAVLCLVKELDYPSLEVVEIAVRNRMDELEE